MLGQGGREGDVQAAKLAVLVGHGRIAGDDERAAAFQPEVLQLVCQGSHKAGEVR